MEKLKERLEVFEAALKTLEEINRQPASTIVRDATIQRFEYTTETAWKALKHFLLEHEGIECNTPKGCARECFKAGLLDEEETNELLRLINDRNLSSHTYIQELAQKIASTIPEYTCLLRKIADRIEAETDE